MAGSSVKARLVSKSLTAPGMVEFQFNPDKISVSRRAALTNRGNASSGGGFPGGASPSIFRRAAAASITVNDVLFRGDTVKVTCDQLLNWISPGGGLLGAVAGAALSAATGGRVNLASRLPTLVFSWGPPLVGFMYDVVLASCVVNYTRFNSDGIPIRASVNLTMQEQPSLLGTLPTNPTSGGLPGRRKHVVADGENLQSIAMANYGSPGRWRWLAEANRIDDPLKVRPGDVLYLPNPGEVADDAAAAATGAR